MKLIPENKKLSEVRKRIKKILVNIKEHDIKSDGVIIDDAHSMYFTIRNEYGMLKGEVRIGVK